MNEDARRAFLGELIDDAGLFPPARLPLPEAVAAHERAAATDAFWIVGRFVVPGTRLAELAAALDAAPEALEICAIVEPREGRADEALASLAARAATSPRIALEALETPLGAIAGSTDDERLERLLAALDAAPFERMPALYVEVAAGGGDAPEGILALRRARERAPRRELYAKLRCGGQSPGAVPDAAAVAAFIWEANRLDVPFKATAGLHHAVRGAGGGGAAGHGFLNVIGAAVLARARGLDRATVEAVVSEREPGRFELGERRFAWAGIGADAAEIGDARARFVHSFGSCSLEEPLDDLRALGMLPGVPAR